MGIGSAMYPGTNVYYKLSTPNGHGFTSLAWMDLLKNVDPDVARSSTLTVFTPGLDAKRVASPILDRMAVQYVVSDPRQTLYGSAVAASTEPDAVVLRSGGSVEAPIANGPLRGVALTVKSTGDLVRPAWIRAEILDGSGRIIATNRRRIEGDFERGVLSIALAADTGTAVAGTARFRIEGTTGSIALVGSAGVPAVQVVQPEDDQLQLVFAGAANVWRRTGALARVRWASEALVLRGARDRVRWLATNTNTNEVLLDQPQAPTDGLGATIVRSVESGDQRRITVDALGSGYVVVADALADGWQATVDGKAVSLLAADHAMGAVRVGKGRHVVALDYSPPRQRVGLAVSLATAIMLGFVGFGGLRRKRNRPHAESSALVADH